MGIPRIPILYVQQGIAHETLSYLDMIELVKFTAPILPHPFGRVSLRY
jgi:hypothetical protein